MSSNNRNTSSRDPDQVGDRAARQGNCFDQAKTSSAETRSPHVALRQLRERAELKSFDRRIFQQCRCCLKVRYRSSMVEDQFCDLNCCDEWLRNGSRTVTDHILCDLSTCCCCGKEVLVHCDGYFQPIQGYRCVDCRTAPRVVLDSVESFPSASDRLPFSAPRRRPTGPGA